MSDRNNNWLPPTGITGPGAAHPPHQPSRSVHPHELTAIPMVRQLGTTFLGAAQNPAYPMPVPLTPPSQADTKAARAMMAVFRPSEQQMSEDELLDMMDTGDDDIWNAIDQQPSRTPQEINKIQANVNKISEKRAKEDALLALDFPTHKVHSKPSKGPSKPPHTPPPPPPGKPGHIPNQRSGAHQAQPLDTRKTDAYLAQVQGQLEEVNRDVSKLQKAVEKKYEKALPQFHHQTDNLHVKGQAIEDIFDRGFASMDPAGLDDQAKALFREIQTDLAIQQQHAKNIRKPGRY
ncbi:MAG: hypothetical protein ACOYKZ_01730 [Chlamydiia bacterium]